MDGQTDSEPVARMDSALDPDFGGEHGQGLAEYALILALIAIVAIVALLFLGTAISSIINSIGQSI